MKKRILLIDESLTVQKVVALTLDKERYAVTNAKSRSEAMKIVLESPPDLILVSEQVPGVSAAFAKEVESWVGRDRKLPAIVLISAHDTAAGNFHAILKKPFSPQALQTVVTQALGPVSGAASVPERVAEDSRMEKLFSEAFSDEATLVGETLRREIDSSEDTLLNIPAPSKNPPKTPSAPPRSENVAELWGSRDAEAPVMQVLGAEDSMAYKANLEKEVYRQLEAHNLEDIVYRLLEKIVPPIVERVARERLDQLLKESEGFAELKP